MKVLDVNKMKLSKLDITLDQEKFFDKLSYNQSVEWHGKVYMLGYNHIHVITKDCKKYELIENQGFNAAEKY